MSTYTERVARNLEGLEAVSTGICPGCAECRDNYGNGRYCAEGEWVPAPVKCPYCRTTMRVEDDTMPSVSGHCRNCGTALSEEVLAQLDNPVEVEQWNYAAAPRDSQSYDTEAEAQAAADKTFADDCMTQEVSYGGEVSFSTEQCDICDTRLAGDREPWHAIQDGKIRHFTSACTDCVMYLANGDLP